jgi:single-strand DNA-binding protein
MHSRVILLGRFTRDPELKYASSGLEICTFSLAVDSGWGDKKKTSFLDCTAFGKRGEAISNNLHKGDPIFIEGYLDQSRWEDKDTGQKRSKVGIIVDDFKFLPKSSESHGQADGSEPPPF